jgi:hypothetical protein
MVLWLIFVIFQERVGCVLRGIALANQVRPRSAVTCLHATIKILVSYEDKNLIKNRSKSAVIYLLYLYSALQLVLRIFMVMELLDL